MFVFRRVKPVITHSDESQAVLNRLEQFLQKESPQVVYWIQEVFERQQNSVTYAELRNAMLNGYEQQIQKWQEDYAQFVNEKLAPVWNAAIKAGAAQLQTKLKEFILDDSDRNIKDWVRLHTGEFITNIGEETRAAIKAILAHGQDEGWSAQQMAQAVRPCIGLTRPDALANARYQQTIYENLLKTNMPEVAAKKAHEAALRYGEKQHRARAEMIANTELAFAYNRGHYEGVRQAMAQGLMGACEKVWLTAGKGGRVCAKCDALNGKRVGFEDPFNIAGKELYRGMHQTPPAHPRCRCVIQYVEYTSPVRQPQKLPSTANKPIVDTRSILDAEDFFKDMSVIPADRYGVCIRSDSNFLEGMNLSARREIVNGQEQYCLYGKFTDAGSRYIQSALKKSGAVKSEFGFMRMDETNNISYFADKIDLPTTINSLKLKTSFGEIEMVTDAEARALHNFFTLRVPANAKALKSVEDMLDEIGAKYLMDTPSESSVFTYKLRKAIWSRHPEIKSEDLFLMSNKKMLSILEEDNITREMVANLRLENVWNGYSTFIDETLIKAAHDADVKCVWSGVKGVENVVKVIKSGGLSCSKERLTAGFKGNGASIVSDIKSGGADGVFTRMGVKSEPWTEEYSCCFCGDGYRIKIDPSVLGRTDWYAYNDDNFGSTAWKYFSERSKLEDLAAELKEQYLTGNEIIFRNGIRSDKFIGINCDDEFMRNELLEAFAKAGIKEINGIPVEKFVTIETEIGVP